MSDDPRQQAFTYQLDMLKLEVEVVNSTIRQIDDISKSLKEWTVTIWAAGVGGALVTSGMRRYIWATAAVPLLFWIVDSHHKVVQRRFGWRCLRIMDFLNDDRLARSFEEKRLVDFTVMDLASRRDRSPGYRRFVSWPNAAFFGTVSLLYLGLAMISTVVWLLCW